MKWLFRVDIATERETDDTKKARGLGHAYKCLSLAKEIKKRNGEAKFSIKGAKDIESFFESYDMAFTRSEDHISVINEYNPEVVVTDINYHPTEKMHEYREHATVVNIAPRGECKYYSDYTFTSAQIEDVTKPSNATVRKWYSGPSYAILNPEVAALRKELENTGWNNNAEGLVIQMGGVDQVNMTGRVMDLISEEVHENKHITVIAGPFNPHTDELQNKCAELKNTTFTVDPPDFPRIVADHELGIFGTGISTYEALSLGVPSINLGLSSFHDRRGEVLESDGLGRYLGRYDDVSTKILNKTIRNLLDSDELVQIRKRGIKRVDGRATERIVDKIKNSD